jgi:hypothetical protein
MTVRSPALRLPRGGNAPAGRESCYLSCSRNAVMLYSPSPPETAMPSEAVCPDTPPVEPTPFVKQTNRTVARTAGAIQSGIAATNANGLLWAAAHARRRHGRGVICSGNLGGRYVDAHRVVEGAWVLARMNAVLRLTTTHSQTRRRTVATANQIESKCDLAAIHASLTNKLTDMKADLAKWHVGTMHATSGLIAHLVSYLFANQPFSGWTDLFPDPGHDGSRHRSARC